MELNNTIVKDILSCNWLSNSGISQDVIPDVDCDWIKDRSHVIKNFKSIKWENICLEARNDVTGYLAKNNTDSYNDNWNILVRKVKADIIPKVIDSITEQLRKHELPEEISDNIKMDIVSILVVLSYKEYCLSPFYEKLLEIYKSGHLPCGWDGKYPLGKFEVY
jgi:hypothetical protein